MQEISLKGLRVLVLDDEFLVGLDLERLLFELGADAVIIACNLGEIDAGAAFDVAVLELVSAGRPTVEFAAALAARGVPLAFTTGRSDAAALLVDLPGVPVVEKPFTRQAVARALALALEGRPGR